MTATGAPVTGSETGPVLLARSVCRFRHFKLVGSTTLQVKAVLRNQLIAWAPFDHARYAIVLRGRSAMVWAWDGDAVRAASGSLATSQRCYPEGLTQTAVTADTERLVLCVQGVEAQSWRRGELLSSQWWPQVPNEQQWERWCASLGLAQGQARPPLEPPQALHWVKRPWAEPVDIEALLSTSSPYEGLAVRVALVGLVGLSTAQGQQAWSAYRQMEAASGERDRQSALVQPVIAARDRAFGLAARIAELSAQLTAPHPIEVMQHLAERLPPQGVLLRELELSGTHLRLGLETSANVSRATVVKELQAGGWFTNVAESREVAGRGWLMLDLDLNGAVPPPRAAAVSNAALRPSLLATPEPVASRPRP